jgi:hypothetical protein
MGDINIEIESDSSPKIIHDAPSHVFAGSSPPRSNGTISRRAASKEIPSTPGTSPIKFRTGGSEDEEENFLDNLPRRSRREHEDDAIQDEEIDEEEHIDIESRTGIGAFGLDNQALFEGDDDDLVIPDLEITPSPRKHDKTLSSPSKVLTSTKEWVIKKANRYKADQDLVWWILERTTGHRKLAVKALKSFLKTDGTSF